MSQLDGLDTPVAENMDATSIMSQSVWQFKRSVNKQTKNLRVTHRHDPLQEGFQTRTAKLPLIGRFWNMATQKATVNLADEAEMSHNAGQTCLN